MSTKTIHLDCPLCHATDALTCKIVRPGPALWVSLLDKTCACRPSAIYQAWDVTWWQALATLAHDTPSAKESC